VVCALGPISAELSGQAVGLVGPGLSVCSYESLLVPRDCRVAEARRAPSWLGCNRTGYTDIGGARDHDAAMIFKAVVRLDRQMGVNSLSLFNGAGTRRKAGLLGHGLPAGDGDCLLWMGDDAARRLANRVVLALQCLGDLRFC